MWYNNGERRGVFMIILYILGGVICLALAIYLIDRREKLVHEKEKLEFMKKDIEETNQMLDELQEELDEMNESFVKINHISKEILSFRK